MPNHEKIVLQELLASEGRKIYQSFAIKLQGRLTNDLLAAGREGDGVRSAKFTGQIDIIPVMLKLPETELKKMG